MGLFIPTEKYGSEIAIHLIPSGHIEDFQYQLLSNIFPDQPSAQEASSDFISYLANPSYKMKHWRVILNNPSEIEVVLD